MLRLPLLSLLLVVSVLSCRGKSKGEDLAQKGLNHLCRVHSERSKCTVTGTCTVPVSQKQPEKLGPAGTARWGEFAEEVRNSAGCYPASGVHSQWLQQVDNYMSDKGFAAALRKAWRAPRERRFDIMSEFARGRNIAWSCPAWEKQTREETQRAAWYGKHKEALGYGVTLFSAARVTGAGGEKLVAQLRERIACDNRGELLYRFKKARLGERWSPW
ncbi:hypothetical protein KJ865_10690, partial [Myxococcota bacterium]|nr:hypothetical protein [Myxococcota bacterium]